MSVLKLTLQTDTFVSRGKDNVVVLHRLRLRRTKPADSVSWRIAS